MNETIERARQMVEKFPENELARFSLGKADHDAGQIESARDQFNIALVRKPDWMVVQILLGKCELSLGNRDAARAAFQRALHLAIEQHHEGPQAEMEQLLQELN